MDFTIHIFWYVDLNMDRTDHVFWYVELDMDRTVHIFWYVDVAGRRRGLLGSPGGRRAVAGVAGVGGASDIFFCVP